MSESLRPFDPRGTVLGDEVYARVGEAIIDGTLAPGERLRDHELARRLGGSRTPVREALQRLERVGLVEVAPNRYTRVSIPSQKSREDVREFLVLSAANAARFAMKRGSDEDIATSVDLADVVVEASASDDYPAIVQASWRLFSHLMFTAGNVMRLKVMKEAQLAIRRYTSQWQPYFTDVEERTAKYRELRDALLARDGIRAERAVRAVYGLD